MSRSRTSSFQANVFTVVLSFAIPILYRNAHVNRGRKTLADTLMKPLRTEHEYNMINWRILMKMVRNGARRMYEPCCNFLGFLPYEMEGEQILPCDEAFTDVLNKILGTHVRVHHDVCVYATARRKRREARPVTAEKLCIMARLPLGHSMSTVLSERSILNMNHSR